MSAGAKEEGLLIKGFSSDGDTKLLSAMMFKSINPEPSSIWTWFNADSPNPTHEFTQDIFHIIVKLKTRLLKASAIFPLGNNYLASSGHIVQLITDVSRDQHNLFLSFVDSKDKMNFKAAQKLCDPVVTSSLRKYIPHSKGTRTYLEMMKDIMDSCLDPLLTPLQRIKKLWKWIFFLRYWRKWI